MLCVFIFFSLLPALPAHAALLAGRIGASGTTEANVVTAFGADATGDVAPVFLLGGPATGMETANGLSYDAVGNLLLVADFFGQKVLVFALSSRGDAAPLRAFTSPGMSQPRVAVAIAAQGEIAVASSFNVQYYDLLADGSVAAIRSTSFDPSVIDNLSSLAYLPASDEVAVGDGFNAGGGSYAGEVLFFDRTATSVSPPARRIAGPATGLGTFASGLALDEARGELYVLVAEADQTASIQVFDQDADGDVAPLRSISGPATLLFNAGGIGFDAERDEVVVASGSYNSPAARLLAFPRMASGDVAPSRNISGPATGVVAPDGWVSVLAVPLDKVFRDGFE